MEFIKEFLANYHNFSEDSTWSNIFIIIASIYGLCRAKTHLWKMMFKIGIIMGFASIYYHIKPNDYRLFWDRLPMTWFYCILLVIFLEERKGIIITPTMLITLLSIYTFTDIYWARTGKLLPYGIAQFGTFTYILYLLYRHPQEGDKKYYYSFLAFGAAKVTELFDRQIYKSVNIGGHTLKHLLSALGIFLLA